jgi:hypothetical protein
LFVDEVCSGTGALITSTCDFFSGKYNGPFWPQALKSAENRIEHKLKRRSEMGVFFFKMETPYKMTLYREIANNRIKQ